MGRISARDFETVMRQPLLCDLEPATVKRLRASAEVRRAPAGTTLILEADPNPDALFVLLEGEVAITREDRLLVLQRAPSVVGLLSLLDNGVRTASISAFSDVRLARLPAETFHEMLAASPQLGRNVVAHLTRELRNMHRADADTRARFEDHFISPNARLIPGPWAMMDAEIDVFIIAGPTSLHERLLPDGLQSVGDALGLWLLTFGFYPEMRTLHEDASARPIRFAEAAPLIPVRDRSGALGLFCPEAYPDNYMAIFLGREVYGLPRRIGALRRGEREIDLDVDQGLLLRASWTGTSETTPEAFTAALDGVPAAFSELVAQAGAALASVSDGEIVEIPLMVRNQVPDVVSSDGDELRIDELLEVPIAMTAFSDLRALDGPTLRRFSHDWMLSGKCIGAFRARTSMTWSESKLLRRLNANTEL